MKKKFLSLLLFSALVLTMLSGCSKQDDTQEPDNAGNPVAVETASVARGDLSLVQDISGKITAEENIPVIATTGTKVLDILVKEGDEVRRGDLLFITDSTDINNQYVPAKKAYERTKAATDAALALARQNLENSKKLYEIGAISKVQLDQEEAALLSQEASLLGQLDQLELSLDKARDALSDSSVFAPASGVVTSLSLVRDAYPPQTQPALIISRVGKVSAEFSVSENMLPYLEVGKAVQVTLSSDPSAVFDATIDTVSQTADGMTQLYTVTALLDNAGGSLKPGMFVTLSFSGDSRKDAVLVPTKAILTQGDKSVVYVLDGENAKYIEVTPGISDGTQTEILNGLSGGETVIVKGQDYVSDGSPVKVVGGAE